jgi:hypothetical protein
MKRWWLLKGIKVLVFVALAISATGYVVMSLWNWLLPPLLGVHTLVFTQAVGMLMLCRILFGGIRGHRGAFRHRMRERWESMTPEERERVRAGVWRHSRCRGAAADGGSLARES